MDANGALAFGSEATVYRPPNSSSPAGHPAVGQVLVGTRCWSCEKELFKTVPGLHRGHGHFSWACEACEVAWSGPAEEIRSA